MDQQQLPEIIDKVYGFHSRQKICDPYPVKQKNLNQSLKGQTQSEGNLGNTFKKKYEFCKSVNSTQATRFYNSSSKKERQSQGNGKDQDYDQINQLLLNQNSQMRIIMDNMSRNVIIYTPSETNKNKFKPPQYSEKLKALDKQIFQYQKILERAYKNQNSQINVVEEIPSDKFDVNQIQQDQQQKNDFDFLTGVGIQGQQNNSLSGQEEKQMQEVIQEEKIPATQRQETQNQSRTQDVQKAFTNLYEHYQNQISKAFLDKEQKQKQLRKKRPIKLSITSKNNCLEKTGQPFDELEKNMRVYNREHFPCKPEVLVPSFAPKKDAIANSVLAYLKDYKPLLKGDKDNIPKSIQSLLEVELNMMNQVQQMEKLITLQNNQRIESAKEERNKIKSADLNNKNKESHQRSVNKDIQVKLLPIDQNFIVNNAKNSIKQ